MFGVYEVTYEDKHGEFHSFLMPSYRKLLKSDKTKHGVTKALWREMNEATNAYTRSIGSSFSKFKQIKNPKTKYTIEFR